MSEGPFNETPEVARFKEVMRGVMSVSKKRLDELLKASRDESPRKDNPKAPGRKRVDRGQS